MKLVVGLPGVLLLAALLQPLLARVYENQMTFASFRRGGGWVFLTKMTLEKGEMQATFESRIRGTPFSTLEPIDLLIVDEDVWPHHLQAKCQANSNSFHTVQELRADGSVVSNKFVLNIAEEKTYYFIIRDCSNRMQKEYSNSNLHLSITLTILNNSSHLSADEDNWLIFPLIFAIGIWLVVCNKKENIWGEDFDWAKFLLMAAVGANLSALFWKGVGFLVYASNGHDYAIFDIFYLGLHSISETVVLCLVVMIAYGWTINYLNGEDFDLYIPLMTMLGLLNTIVTILNKINDSDHDKYHMYDSVPGYLLVGFRCIIMLIYVIGIAMTYRSSLPKKRPFIIQFGVLGLIYVLSLPLLIIITEMFVGQRMQKQFLFVSVEGLKTLSTILLTYMITSKKSSYAKVCYRSLSFLPQNEKFF